MLTDSGIVPSLLLIRNGQRVKKSLISWLIPDELGGIELWGGEGKGWSAGQVQEEQAVVSGVLDL